MTPASRGPRWASIILLGGLCLCLCAGPAQGDAGQDSLRFDIRFPARLCPDTLDGRLLLLLSTDDSEEPRFQVKDGPETQLAFGIDVEGLAPGQAGGRSTPASSATRRQPRRDAGRGVHGAGSPPPLRDLPPRRRPHGEAPHGPRRGPAVEQGARQSLQPPRKVTIDPAAGGAVEIVLDRVIPPIPDPPTTKYVRHVRIQSELLTEFWGRPMHLGAHVLLPEGFDEHPEARYPLVIFHGHFPARLRGLPRGAARPRPRARVLRRGSTRRLQPDRAGVRVRRSTRSGPAPTSRG